MITTEEHKRNRGGQQGERREAYKRFKLLPDGTYHSAQHLAQEFGVNQSTISRNHKKGKTTYTRDELRKWAADIASGSSRNRMSLAEKIKAKQDIDDIFYEPTLMERAMLRCR